MNNQQTLAQAQIVEQLLEQNGVTVADVNVTTECEELFLTIDLNDVDVDPDADSTPIDPARVGGGTIKE